MSESTEQQEMPAELIKNSQQLAMQAALRAKEMQSRGRIPEVPARGDQQQIQQKAPQIPPKRLNLKQTTEDSMKEPIPLPQRNQPQRAPPIPDKPMMKPNEMPVQPTMLQQQSQQPAINNLSVKNQNIVNILNSPLFQQRTMQMKHQIPNINANKSPFPEQLQNQNMNVNLMQQNQRKPVLDPQEDYGSEDALRGIERGLKNMERAMQEQLNFKNMDGKPTMNFEQGIQFNPIEFKRSLGGGSINALDGSSQNIRMNFDASQFRIERGISMDQMRLELMQQQQTMNNGPSSKGKIMDNGHQQAIQHNIYRSLDRNLPLELQYSRHRPQDIEFLRQYNQNAMLNRQNLLSRDDIRIRRRSSHDETQYQQIPQHNNNLQNQPMQQGQQQVPGKFILCEFLGFGSIEFCR